MKRITLFEHQVGLVLKDGNYLRTLTAGKHWLGWGETMRLYGRTAAFTAPVELNILLADEDFRKEVELVSLTDHELALHYENGVFKAVLGAGQHVFWKSVVEHRFELIDKRDAASAQQLDRNLFGQVAILRHLNVFKVESYERGLLFVDGKLEQQLGAGTYYFWQNGENRALLKADTRKQQLEVAGQEMLTKDKASLRINFHLHYQLVDLEQALLQRKEYVNQLYLLAQLALRAYVGTLTLDELLARKEDVNAFVLEQVRKEAKQMGITLHTAGIRDIILPGEMKTIMNQVLVAEKQAQANTILRREETASTRSLLNTAKLMEDNLMLQRLKEMEYVEKIADKINNISLSGGGHLVEQLREIFVQK